MDVSSEMIYPLIPIFLTSVLGANKAVVGLIEGIAESTASLLKVLSGYLSDRSRKRKPLILSGYSLSTISRPIVALASSWVMVMVYRFIDRIGKGIRTAPRDAVIAESTGDTVLGRAFGFHRAMDTLGAAVGPGLAIVILYLYDIQYPLGNILTGSASLAGRAFRAVFWASIVPGSVAVLLILLFVREKTAPARTGYNKFSFRWTNLGSEFRRFLLIATLFTLGNSSNTFIILKAQEVGMGILLITELYLIFNLVYSISAMPAGMVADRFGKKRMILLGYLLFGFIYTGLALSSTQTAMWVLFLLYGIFMGISEGIQRAFVATLLARDYMGTGYGVYHTVIGLAALPSSIIAGILWDILGSRATFLFGAATALLSSLLFVVLFWRQRET